MGHRLSSFNIALITGFCRPFSPGVWNRSFSTQQVSRHQGFLVFPPNCTAEGTAEVVEEEEKWQQALWLRGCPRSITVLDKLHKLYALLFKWGAASLIPTQKEAFRR